MAITASTCLRLLALILACATAPAAVVHVKADASGAGNGSSWANAHPSLAAAITASRSGDQLWIAAGTYRPGTQRSSTFTPKAGTALYGGFRGTETALAERSGDATLTVLSGDVGVAGTASDNTNHVVWIQGDGSYALHDLTITGGYADGPVGTGDSSAGGIFLTALLGLPLAADLTLENCRITGNQAGTSAAIHSLSTGALTLRRCLITGNRQVAGHGSTGNIALFINGSLAMERCVVAGNAANAASIFAEFDISVPATITNCLFVDNQARGPSFARDATVNACTLAGNRTSNLALNATNVTLIIANSIVMSPYQAGLSHVFDTWWEGDAGGAVPGFRDAANPVGADGLWFTADDGYQLAATSPLIDTIGSTGWVPPPASDLRGLLRPQGRQTDPGAYEYDQGGQAPVVTSQIVNGLEDSDLAITVLGSDADSAVLTGRILSLPARGSLLPTLDGVTAAGPALTAAELPWRIADSQRRVLYRPAADTNGSNLASFTVDLDDGSHTSFPATIFINLAAVDDPPTLDQPADQLLAEDTSLALTLTRIGPGGGETQAVTVTATAADPSLFSTLQVSYTGPATTATLTLVPVLDAYGATTVSVTVSDGTSLRSVAFRVTVWPVNDPPRLLMQPGLLMNEDTPTTVACFVIGAGPANENEQIPGMRIFASSVNPDLVVVEGIDWTPGPLSDAILHLRPMPNATGEAQVVVTLIDDSRYSGGPLATSEILDIGIVAVNDPPVLVRNLPQAVTRGGRVVLGTAALLINDPDAPPATDLRLTLTVLPLHGTVELDLAPLAVGGGFTLQDLIAGKVSYLHDGSAAAGDLFTLEFTDGLIARPHPTVAVPVSVDGKVLPLVTLPATGPTWHEGEPPLALAATATVSDADSELMAAGQMTVTVAGGDAGDLLAIADQGAGAGQIALSGTTVRFGGRAIGSWQGGSGGSPLVVALAGADATLEAVQALVRALTFGHAGGDPGSATRTVTVVVDDGDSGASPPATTTVAVVPRDDPPTIRTSTLSIPAGATLALELAAEDSDSPLLTWSLVTAPARAACTLVDSARGRLRLTAPADARGSDRIGVTVSDGANPPVSAAILLVITGPDDLRPLPAAEFPGEAFADEVLRVDIPWDCRLLPGALLTFAATTDAPAGLALTATGATSVRATWAVPAGEAPGHRRFAIIASDTVSGASGLLPVLLPVRARPGGSN